ARHRQIERSARPLGRHRNNAGVDAGGAAADSFALDDGDRRSLLREVIADSAADYAAADHYYVRLGQAHELKPLLDIEHREEKSAPRHLHRRWEHQEWMANASPLLRPARAACRSARAESRLARVEACANRITGAAHRITAASHANCCFIARRSLPHG